MSLFSPNNPTTNRALTVVEAGMKAITSHPDYRSHRTKGNVTTVTYINGEVRLDLGLQDSTSTTSTGQRLDFGKNHSLAA